LCSENKNAFSPSPYKPLRHSYHPTEVDEVKFLGQKGTSSSQTLVSDLSPLTQPPPVKKDTSSSLNLCIALFDVSRKKTGPLLDKDCCRLTSPPPPPLCGSARSDDSQAPSSQRSPAKGFPPLLFLYTRPWVLSGSPPLLARDPLSDFLKGALSRGRSGPFLEMISPSKEIILPLSGLPPGDRLFFLSGGNLPSSFPESVSECPHFVHPASLPISAFHCAPPLFHDSSGMLSP